MRNPKPQRWIREYSGALVMRIETNTAGRWLVSGDGWTEGLSRLPYQVEAMQTHADNRAGAPAVGAWRRICQRCDAPMSLAERNRPDSGAPSTIGHLWVCTSRSCGHAEGADD